MNARPVKPFTKNDPRINRAGRPRTADSLTCLLREYLDTQAYEMSEKTKKQLLVEKLYELAIAGNLAAIIYIFNRVDGSPRQSIEVQNNQEDKLATLLDKFNQIGLEEMTA